MPAAAIAFLLSLALIALLFALKHWEVSRGRELFPRLHRAADDRAADLKLLARRGGTELQKLPPFLIYVGRLGVHETALGMARLARILERRAHGIAELVSHKRSFEHRETRSEFLRKVSDRAVSSDADAPKGEERDA